MSTKHRSQFAAKRQPQLILVEDWDRDTSDDHRLDEHTRQIGLAYVEKARALLREAAQRAAAQQGSSPAA
ncbi:MAG: hypothetical protein AB7L13_23785 [Acidimicrobiia bacterium]